ncbi:hypothetical protein EH165_12020 [Nakamurella antarctica]|uniref:O-succinylbenzoic acid--CoA ligase n=1 Tax=Nakamurella antarctica TaxID=1902245 RepID=A0A3G8ZYV2_9ACTN|nr:o-succinylbenzoate--CoA ligase [Nakamurella antarctica]AZI58751.1 hypothetical protein EH165_12020 [Nakamurella antarctica]
MANKTSRTLQALPVPTGPAVLGLLEPLAAALAGTGPALLPVPSGNPALADTLCQTLRAGEALDAGEDDDSDPTALVIATSGSSGIPKGALLSTGALSASATAAHSRLAGDKPATWLLALPAHHIAGMNVLLRAARDGAEPCILDTATSFTPGKFIAAVHAMPSGPRLVSLVPTQLQRLLPVPEAMAALATFTSVLVGGAAATPGQLQQARDAGATIVTSYGMSETCGGCLYDGLPLDSIDSWVDVPAGGRVWLFGPSVARGYRGMPGHPAFTTRPPEPTCKRDGRAPALRQFRTDDIARRSLDGRVEIIGRIDDLIITGGAKIAPIAVEAVLAAVPGVRDVVITSIPDDEWGHVLVAVVVANSHSQPPTLASLRTAASFVLGTVAAPKHLLLVDEFPTRGPGKHDRAALADLAAHTLK